MPAVDQCNAIGLTVIRQDFIREIPCSHRNAEHTRLEEPQHIIHRNPARGIPEVPEAGGLISTLDYKD
jgi:hypothetical protein